MILKGLSFTLGVDDLYGAGLRINRLNTTLHVGDIDGVKYILQRRRQSLGARLVKPWADDKRRFRGYQRDFKLFGRDAFDIAQTGCGKCGVHAGETGAYNHKSHNVYSVSCGFEGRAPSLPLRMGDDRWRAGWCDVAQAVTKASMSALTISAWVVHSPCGSFS